MIHRPEPYEGSALPLSYRTEKETSIAEVVIAQ